MLPVELQAARRLVVKNRPYFATAVFALQPVEKPGLETMGVDARMRLYYDPAVLKKWSAVELASVLYHELLHVLRNHASRRIWRDPRKWNVACDIEINDDIQDERIWKLPGRPLLPEAFGLAPRMLAEEIYDKLPRAEGYSSNDVNDGDNSNGSSGCAPGEGRCGSCATGMQEEWEDDISGANKSGLSPIEVEVIRKTVASEINKAVGNVPGHLKRFADGYGKPITDWRKVLSREIRSAVAFVSGCHDYSYTRPSRRQIENIVTPSMIKPVMKAAIVIDTSMSIGDELLNEFLSECEGVIKTCGSACDVIVVDHAVQAVVKNVNDAKRVRNRLKGGGGTDMGIGIAKACELGAKLIIVLTDGWTPWPNERPKARVIIGLAPNGNDSVPEWARLVKLDQRR